MGRARSQARGAAVAIALGATCSVPQSVQASATAKPELEGPPASGRPSVALAVVTRDWEGGSAVLGRLIPTDFLRPSRSSQLLVGRLRLSGGHLASFVQLGLGYWRLDTDLLPKHAGELDRAAQVGAGIEWGAAPEAAGVSLALESESTVLLRDRRAAPSTCHRGGEVAVGMLVARVRF